MHDGGARRTVGSLRKTKRIMKGTTRKGYDETAFRSPVGSARQLLTKFRRQIAYACSVSSCMSVWLFQKHRTN